MTAPPAATPAISIATSFDYQVPFEEQVALIAEAGFAHLSLGAREDHTHFRSPAGRARIAALLRANGLALDTIHGPRLDQPDGTRVLAEVAAAAAALGDGVVVVIHASPFERRFCALSTSSAVGALQRPHGVKRDSQVTVAVDCPRSALKPDRSRAADFGGSRRAQLATPVLKQECA